jgi:hypothetical protein
LSIYGNNQSIGLTCIDLISDDVCLPSCLPFQSLNLKPVKLRKLKAMMEADTYVHDQKVSKPSGEVLNALNAPGHWDVFISHTQRNGNAKYMAEKLHTALKELGLRAWLDVKMDDKSEAAMKEGVVNSKCLIAIITGMYDGDIDNAYFKRAFCIKELEWAREASVYIKPVIHADDKGNIGTFMEMAPPAFQDLGSINFAKLQTDDEDFWNLCVKKMINELPFAL